MKIIKNIKKNRELFVIFILFIILIFLIVGWSKRLEKTTMRDVGKDVGIIVNEFKKGYDESDK